MAVGTYNMTYDASLILEDGAASITASEANSDIVDLGSAGIPRSAPLGADVGIDAAVLIDVTAIAIDGGDEGYDIIVQGSPDSDFGTAASIKELIAIHLGASGTKRSDSDRDDTIGRFIVPFVNYADGVTYRYIRTYNLHTGATTAITYTARIVTRG